MPLSVTKGEGVTVLTINSDPGSSVPLVIQLLGALCCSPLCFVSQGLKRLLAGTQTALGFIAAGLMSMLGERFPSPCLVFLTAFMNLASACLAVTAIVLYSVDLGSGQGLRWKCNSYETATYRSERRRYRYRYDDYDHQTITPTPYDDRGVNEFKRRTNFDICQSTRDVLLVLLGGIDILLIIFAVLQLCVAISATVLGVKALCKSRTEGKV
ncbi:hypothetical protein SKAU_G00221550 [Synaphobranchus kaupii]|uniref:Uncharacterized protein n=1 Tax=Synaphobranchus kaupii TaxID=118154 RepID=A0A9Q1IW35_SYNKA|nr:hypothetical protein SKAU_G00221550 [Synaphobranchus kaupii]